MDCAWMWQQGCDYDTNATAAWVQAVGSVIAILVSGALAIFAPLYVRDQEERAAVQRALTTARHACGLMISAWEALRNILQAAQFHGSTRETIMSAVSSSRAMLANIPHSLLSPETLVHVNRCTFSATSLDELTRHLHDKNDPSAGATIKFDNFLGPLYVAQAALLKTAPLRAGLFWTTTSDEGTDD